METLGRIGGGAYCIVGAVIGLRLLLLATRTRKLPELLIGVATLFMAGLGYPLSAVAREAPDLGASTRVVLGATGALLAVAGLAANTGFTWMLFRRGVAWANSLFALIGLGAAGLFVAQSIGGSWAAGEFFWRWLPFGVVVSFGWAFLECGRYHLLLRRRLRLGMADPIVTNRFALYAVATGIAVITAFVGWVYIWLHLEMVTDPVGGLLLFGLGTTSSSLMLLAFLPPRGYLAWLRVRAPEEVKSGG
jgi:hypothetical protein